jgi:hypothetical protein
MGKLFAVKKYLHPQISYELKKMRKRRRNNRLRITSITVAYIIIILIIIKPNSIITTKRESWLSSIAIPISSLQDRAKA